jgi:MFS family permease
MQGAHDPYGALRLRDYRRLLCGSVLFTLGTEMQAVAVGWELYNRTNSALPFAFAGLAQFLPVLFLALPAGQAADHYSRQKLLMAAQALAGLTSIALAALSWWQGPVALIYLCLLVVGVARAFSVPARWALLPQVIEPELLPNAVTWNSSGFQVANVAGPALGGLLLAQVAPAGVYIATAVCAFCCMLLVGSLRPRPVPPPTEARSLETLLAGLRFVWNTKPILATISLDLFAVLLGGATALLPIYARDVLQVEAAGYGWLRAAPSLGALVTAFIMAHHPPLRHAGKTLLAAVAGFGLATVVFGLSTNYALSFVMLLLTGALDNVSVVVRGTLVQTLTPEAMRGRVGAVNIVFVSSSNELGAFESGVTAHYFGPIASVVMGGIGTVLVVFTVMALWPAIASLSIVRPLTSSEEELDTLEETLAPPA